MKTFVGDFDHLIFLLCKKVLIKEKNIKSCWHEKYFDSVAKVFDCACNMLNSFGYFEKEDDNFRVLTSTAKI